MKTTVEYLDDVKTALNLESDGALARWLGCTRQRISFYRHGLRPLDDMHAFQIEEALGLPRTEVLTANHIERAKSEKEREAWVNFSMRLRRTAASIALLVIGSLAAGPEPTEAATLKVTTPDNTISNQTPTTLKTTFYTLYDIFHQEIAHETSRSRKIIRIG